MALKTKSTAISLFSDTGPYTVDNPQSTPSKVFTGTSSESKSCLMQ